MNEKLSFTEATADLMGTFSAWQEKYSGVEFPLPTIGELMLLEGIGAGEKIPVLIEQHCVSILMHDETCTPAFAAEQTVKLIEAVSEWNEQIIPEGKGEGYKCYTENKVLDILRQIGAETIDNREKRNDLLLEGAQILMDLKQAEKVN